MSKIDTCPKPQPLLHQARVTRHNQHSSFFLSPQISDHWASIKRADEGPPRGQERQSLSAGDRRLACKALALQ